MKIYVASSWRNEERQQACVRRLRDEGHEVYDFRNPKPGDYGFGWKQVTPDGEDLRNPSTYRTALTHSRAIEGFCSDMDALRAADACVLVLPCGRSAHLELGWAVGAVKRTMVWLDDPVSEPELMYRMCDPRHIFYQEWQGTALGRLCITLDDVVRRLQKDYR